MAALKRSKQRFKLVAMTNGQRWALEHMQRTLGNPFDDSITVDEALCDLCDKPDPHFFAFARGRLSPQPQRRRPARHPLYRRGPAARLHRQHAGIRAHHMPDNHLATLAELVDASLMLGITEMKYSV